VCDVRVATGSFLSQVFDLTAGLFFSGKEESACFRLCLEVFLKILEIPHRPLPIPEMVSQYFWPGKRLSRF
jgi:hypothetical protein